MTQTDAPWQGKRRLGANPSGRGHSYAVTDCPYCEDETFGGFPNAAKLASMNLHISGEHPEKDLLTEVPKNKPYVLPSPPK